MVRWLERAGPGGERVRDRVRRQRRRRIARRRRRRRGRRRVAGRKRMKRFARLFAELDQSTSTLAKVDALKRYFAEAAPADAAWAVYFLAGGKPRQVVPNNVLWALACAPRRHRRLALRRLLPGGRRLRRDRRARAAAAGARERPRPGGLGRGAAARAARPLARGAGGARRRVLGRARHRRALSPQQADRRRLSRRRQQAAGAARARRRLGRRRQARGAADDGLHRRARDAERRALRPAHRVGRGRPARHRPAVSVLPRPPARSAGRPNSRPRWRRPTTGSSNGSTTASAPR